MPRLSRKLPGRKFFTPGPVKAWRRRRHVAGAARRAHRVLHLTHGRCLDGAACDAIHRMKYGEVETLYAAPYQTLETLHLIAGEAGNDRVLAVSDLSFQKGQGPQVEAALRALSAKRWRVVWRDHHHKQWEGADLDAFRDAGAAVKLDTTGEECGATLVAKDLLPRDPFANRLAHVVRDNDLWIREEPLSQVLKDAAKRMGSRRFVETILESRDLEDPRIREASKELAQRKAEGVQWGLDHAVTVRGEAARVGVVYGAAPTNETLHTLQEDEGCHLTILLRPEGVFSLRSQEDVKVCHRVAQQFSGGGHPNASGGTLELPWWDLPRYWAMQARHPKARRLALTAAEAVDAHLRSDGAEGAEPETKAA